MANKLSERQRAFVDHFMGKAKGNATAAAKLAGVAPRGAHVWASRALRIPKVQRAIFARQERREKMAILTNDQIDMRLSWIAENPTADFHDQTAAMKELNKCRGRHSMTHVLKGKLTLEQALGRVTRELAATQK